MKKNYNQLNSGFTLVEALVAISIFTVSILGLLSVLAQGVADTGYAKRKIMASYLAQEGIEYARNVRDNYVLYTALTGRTWDQFKALTLSFPSTDPNFVRTIQKIEILSDPGEVKILSTVSWTQPSGSYNIVFSESLFNWTE